MDRIFEFVVNHWELCGLFAALLIALWYSESASAGRTLSPQEAVLLLNRETAVILDIRDNKAYAEGRINGAVHIPFASLKERATELSKYSDKQIILVDANGQHSGTAGKQLKAAGYQNVCRMIGGIAEWKIAGMPLVRKNK